MGVKNKPSVVSLVGGIASGKTTVSDVFMNAGFEVFELSDEIKAYLASRGVETPSRDQYFDAGNEMCGQGDKAFLMRQVINKYVAPLLAENPSAKVLLSGPRRPEDIMHLREVFPGAVVVGINLSVADRISRVLERARDIDPADEAVIRKQIDREWKV